MAESSQVPSGSRKRWQIQLTAAGLLLLAFGLMLSSATRKSATVDEQSHLFRGVAYLKSDATQFLLGHPLLGGMLSALPVLTEANLKLPIDTPAWNEGDWSVSGDAFLWRINEDPLRLIFLGRLPVIWLTMLLGALVFRWGREWAGPAAGLAAMAFILLDPNVLAHGRFVTGDLPLVLFFTLSLYGYWRWARNLQKRPLPGLESLRGRSIAYLLLAGVGLGLAGATKFNAALLLPILLLWGGVLAWQRRSVGPLLALAVVGAAGWLTIWIVYGFELWRGVVPGGAFWDDVSWQLTYVGEQHGVYLLGESSPTGWWSYFPIAFGLKTPLITLVLLGVALYLVIRKRSGSAALFLLAPAVVYFAGSMVVALNIGYRYLLPILPLLFILVAVALSGASPLKRNLAVWVTVIIGVYALLALWVWPDFVPYYNVLAGRDSWRILSDSNVDWGQDLPALGVWQQENLADIRLSYFGTAHPSAYGVKHEPLPTWAPGPEQGDPAKQAYYPPDPAPGTYAISVTNLHGVVLGEASESYARFRDEQPSARIGGSLFVYQVPSHGEPADVAFSGLIPADLAADQFAQLGTNDVRIRWLNAGQSMIWPAEGGWLATTVDQIPITPGLETFWPKEVIVEDADKRLYQLPKPPDVAWPDEPIDFGESLTFLGRQSQMLTGRTLTLLTAWQVMQETDKPLKLFVHALDSSGEIVGQWDGLDVDPASWQAGDVFIQGHQIESREETTPSTLSIGVYDGISLERIGEPVFFALDE